jgi:transcriptional regulator with GAF, ATPase, and Fis domain
MGETGTDKEVVARAIREASPRQGRSLVKMNCGAIPQGLVESDDDALPVAISWRRDVARAVA